jgi:hypothetical protein
MPTTRRRFQVTETESLSRALDLASVRWPGEERSRLLQRVISAGEELLRAQDAPVTLSREATAARVKSAWSEVFEPGYLTELRDDFPE